jgi:phenylalanine-4-hydroxylase
MADATYCKGLRGDYDKAAADFTLAQDWSGYTAEEHARWRVLFERQSAMLPRYAAPEYVKALAAFEMADGVPRFDRANEHLARATGFEIVAVPGLIPDDVFFDHLAARRFPVTVWLRKPEEMDYIVEPDVFHDFFGHVPLLAVPAFADFMAAYGRLGQVALARGALTNLARLYWYMVEFGLIRGKDGLRVYGAGILSSKTELAYAIDDKRPHRIRFSLERVMRTDYRIDDLQKIYFVIDDYDELFAALDRDVLPMLDRVKDRPAIPATETLRTDEVIHRGMGLPRAA